MIDVDVHKKLLIILNLSEKRVSQKHNCHSMINDNKKKKAMTTYIQHTHTAHTHTHSSHGGEKEESQQSRARNAPKNILITKHYFEKEMIM